MGKIVGGKAPEVSRVFSTDSPVNLEDLDSNLMGAVDCRKKLQQKNGLKWILRGLKMRGLTWNQMNTPYFISHFWPNLETLFLAKPDSNWIISRFFSWNLLRVNLTFRDLRVLNVLNYVTLDAFPSLVVLVLRRVLSNPFIFNFIFCV